MWWSWRWKLTLVEFPASYNYIRICSLWHPLFFKKLDNKLHWSKYLQPLTKPEGYYFGVHEERVSKLGSKSSIRRLHIVFCWTSLHSQLALGYWPDDTLDQFFLLLAPGLVRIHLHDPGFYIFNQNPAGPPMERLQFNVKKNMTSIYRMLGMAEMNELNVPSDPCNEDEAYNFNSCVRRSLAMQVQKMNPKVSKRRTGWVPDQVGFRQTT